MKKSDSALGHFEYHCEEDYNDTSLLMTEKINNEANNGSQHENDVEQIPQFQQLAIVGRVDIAS